MAARLTEDEDLAEAACEQGGYKARATARASFKSAFPLSRSSSLISKSIQ